MAKDVIARLKADTKDFDSKFKQSGRALEQFKQQGLGMDNMLKGVIGSFAKFASAGAALAGAMKVAKDAFFANEQQLDEWGRTCESTKALYDGFLNALNTGDISGYLGRMDQIVKAARNAYDAMDELGTFKAFNQRNELQGRNNLQNAINNFREGKGSKEDIQKAGDAYIKELQKRQTIESSNYAAQIRKVAADKGVNANELTKILTGDYASYKKAKDVKPTGKQYDLVGAGAGSTGFVKATDVATNDAERMGEALRMFNDTALEEIQRIGADEIQTSIEIESVRRQMLRATSAKATSGTKSSQNEKAIQGLNIKDVVGLSGFGTGTSDKEYQDRLKYWRDQQSTAKNDFDKMYAGGKIAEIQQEIKLSKITPTEEALTDLQSMIDQWLTQEPVEIKVDATGVAKSAKDTAAAWQAASSAISNAGSAMQSMEDPAAKVAGIVMQAIANVALGFAQASVKDSKFGVWGWIAASTAGLATMVATISQIKSATKMAEGGIVGGSSYVGDATPIMANAGEVVLSAAGQQNISNALQRNDGGSRTPYLTGEMLYLGLNNYGKRSGKGELQFAR